MSKVNLVQKKVQMNRDDIIRYQIVTHCFVNNIHLSINELDCLTLLGLSSEVILADFCNTAVEKKIFKTPQTVRNFLTKAQKNGLVGKITDKSAGNKKKIFLPSDLKIQTDGNIVLDFKMIHLVTQEQ